LKERHQSRGKTPESPPERRPYRPEGNDSRPEWGVVFPE